jgi:hypothetical protein
MIKITTFYDQGGKKAYTEGMSFFVQPTAPMSPKTPNVRAVSLLLVALFIILAVAQLFAYEKFPDILASYWLPGGSAFAHLLAALFVVFEVLAVPFLLSMWLSPAMRVISMVAGWCVIAGWLYLSLVANFTINAIGNSGVLGAAVKVPVGWWMLLFFIVFGGLVAWVSWGMWPTARSEKR